MKNQSLIFGLAVIFILWSVKTFGQTGPGGVGNSTSNVLLLKSTAGTSTTTNGVNISSWNDQSGNGNHVTQASSGNQPVFRTSQLNGYPSISFNGVSTNLIGPSNFPTNSDYTKFVVAKAVNTSPNNNFFSGTNGHAMFLSAGSLQPKLFHNGTFVNSTISMTLNTYALISGTYVNATRFGEIFVNGASGGTGTTGNVNNDGSIFIGSYGNDNYLAGDLTEVIAYNFRLNTAQRIIVENYLAAKYALTISNNRFNYAATHANDVVGIGRVDASNTHLSARSALMLDISQPNAGSFSNGDFLLAGHDGASASSWNTFEIPTSGNIQRLSREWRLTRTGSINTLTLGVTASALPALPATYTTYVIMVDADGDFTSGASVYELPLVSGSQYARANITIADGNYIAIGAVRPTIQFTSATSEQFEPTSQPVQVSLNYIPAASVSVNYSSTAGTATGGGVDYTLAAGTATITASNSTVNIIPSIVNDAIVEPDESFTITLSSPSAGINLGTNTVNTYTIHDDDNARKIAFSAVSSNASESVTTVSLTISINNVDATNSTTVAYSVTGGTATGGGVDFTLASGTATVAANASSTTLNFTVVDDVIYETNETIIISLSSPTNSNLGINYQYTYTINDNETPPVLGFTASSASGLESISSVNFPISMNIASYTSASVSYTVTGTALGGGVDYTLANGTFTIPAGSTSGNINATIVNDLIVETNETIVVTLSSPVNCTLGTTVYTYTIQDDDVFGYTGPGGVGDNTSNMLWLRADLGTSSTADNTAVATWTDQSGAGTNASQGNAGNRPTFRTNQVNSLPVVRFNGSSSFFNCPSVFPTNSDYSKITVTRIANTGVNNNIISGTSVHALFLGGTSSPQLYHSGTFVTSSTPITVGQFSLITGTFTHASRLGELFMNGSAAGSATTSTVNTDNTLQIGAFASGNLLNGDIAEAIAYRVLLNSAQRIIVENYLAAKYNLTIANDKYAFDATHGFEVAGIGRENQNSLHLDAKGSGIVRINTASSVDDGDYLLWGHNGASLTTNSSNVPSGSVLRMSRVWRVAHTNAIGTVNISFDLSGLTVASGNDVELLLDADGDFSNATRYTVGRGYNSTTRVISFTGVNFTHGMYFTLGSTSPATALPIELVGFSATPVKTEGRQSVKITWKTASELNNDFFTVERSQTGTQWSGILEVDGAGTTNVENDYEAIDENPFSGISYYRLKQTDYDGTVVFSKVVRVTMNAIAVSCYPNPANETLTITAPASGKLSLINPAGSEILTVSFTEKATINTTNLPEGLYIVQVNSASGLMTQKIVIKH